jgi:protein-tyrosine-phosphatase
MLSGLVATYVLTAFPDQSPLSVSQLGSAGLIAIALGFLSPLHHFDRTVARLKRFLSSAYGLLPHFVTGNAKPTRAALVEFEAIPAGPGALSRNEIPYENQVKKQSRRLLFVCSGNTSRSPMAAVIGNAEIASRLKIPFEAVDKNGVHTLSAGVSATVGAPMTSEAQQALLQLGFPATQHQARTFTIELADQVEKIFCMTQGNRISVIDLVPTAAAKTQCLDPEGDVEDPSGSGFEAYLKCASRIHTLVRLRLDELGVATSSAG